MRIMVLALLSAACIFAQANPLTQAVTARYNAAKQNLIGAAEAMPAADYGYKLTPSQRAFGEWIEHTTMGNLSYCSAIQGTGVTGSVPKGSDEKSVLQKALQQSFDYCDAALKGMDDQKALAESGGKYPVTAMVSLIASLNEHYGNLVGYLRSKGITPPSSVRNKK